MFLGILGTFGALLRGFGYFWVGVFWELVASVLGVWWALGLELICGCFSWCADLLDDLTLRLGMRALDLPSVCFAFCI